MIGETCVNVLTLVFTVISPSKIMCEHAVKYTHIGYGYFGTVTVTATAATAPHRSYGAFAAR